MREFLATVKSQQIPFRTFHERDVALADHMADLCFLEKRGHSAGVQLLAGFCHFFPEHRGHLPLAGRASSAWTKLEAPLEGGPVPPEALAVVVLQMVRTGRFQAGLGVLVCFDTFFRGHDLFSMRRGDLSRDGDEFAISLGRRHRGDSTKTGTDQGVIVDRIWLGELLAGWEQRVHNGDLLWTIDPGLYRKQWVEAKDEAGLGWLGPAHSVRHSGPALQAYLNQRSLESIRRRGRWTSLGSVQRYTKTHKLVEARSRLSHDQRAEGDSFFKNPVQALLTASRQAPNSKEKRLFTEALKSVRSKADVTFNTGSFDGKQVDEPRVRGTSK